MSILIILIVILLGIVTERGIKKTFPKFSSLHRKGIHRSFIILSAVSVAIMLCGGLFARHISDYRLVARYYFFFGGVAALYISKSVYAMFLFVDWMIPAICKRCGSHAGQFRRIFLKCGFLTGVVTIFLMVWSILFGRYNYTVDHVEIAFNNLPPSFDGFKIVQISDVHAGSFSGSADCFQKAVDMINMQEPNLIVMTGDMVNNFGEETIAVIPIFSQLNARDGKYAVLGNHDYGGYFKWKSPEDSVANHKAISGYIEQMGFVLLNNQSAVISNNNSGSIALIGTEGWGKEKKRPKLGNLEKAMEPVRDIPFKILLAHDPSFWHEKVKGKTDIMLTLSGHTHGMQIGVKLGKKRYSFGLLRGYRYLAGLYQKNRQYLYVNRGLGVIGFPGRIGMSPEITVITLRKDTIFIQSI